MEDIGLFRQGWKWVQSKKQAFFLTHATFRCLRDEGAVLLDRHWPSVSKWGAKVGAFFWMLLFYWKASLIRGSTSLLRLGPAALLVTLWSCLLSFASFSSLACVFLILGCSASSIYYLGYTPGLFIVGLFGILVMWMYGNLWITAVLFMVGGYLFSLNHSRLVFFMATLYSLYYVQVRAGWPGIVLSLNLAFVSNDFLSYFLQVCEGAEQTSSPEEENDFEHIPEEYTGDADNSSPTREPENVSSSRSSSSSTTKYATSQPTASASRTTKTESNSLDEMKRILKSSDHYEALGFLRHEQIDVAILRKEYRKKAVLVHPDKNMGSPLASESFKKLQSAYEVLSDSEKKRNYDDHLRKEEPNSVCRKSCEAFQNGGVDYRSDESRRIQCTKCGNAHLWICTNRSKTRARWCQDCSVYHSAKDGDGWVEHGCSIVFSSPQRIEIPRAFVCAESKIFDVSEWAICQGMSCRPNTHRPSFHVSMVGLDKSAERSNGSKFPWDLDAEMTTEDDEEEFELWLQQALASGRFTETSSKSKKTWSPFKLPLHYRSSNSKKQWRRST